MKKQTLNKQFRRMQELAGLIAETTNQIPGKNGIIILVSDYAKNHIMTHNKIGVGSVFKSGITEDEIEKMVTDVAPKVSGDGDFYELKKPGIGYNLVLPIDKAKSLKDAKKGEVEKQEGSNNITVPSITTSQPLSDFTTDKISLLIKKTSDPKFLPEDVKNDDVVINKMKEGKCYSLITSFPGETDIPKASLWNNEYAVIIPKKKTIN